MNPYYGNTLFVMLVSFLPATIARIMYVVIPTDNLRFPINLLMASPYYLLVIAFGCFCLNYFFWLKGNKYKVVISVVLAVITVLFCFFIGGYFSLLNHFAIGGHK